MNLSPLQKKRLEYQPTLPELLKDLKNVHFKAVPSKKPQEILKDKFPQTFDSKAHQLVSGKGACRSVKIGVVFSGGPAAGGHNVIGALCDAGAEVIGFLDGPSGVIENRSMQIKEIDSYRNQGGFDLLGSGRTKIETQEQLAASLQTVQKHILDGLVIIGGDDSNTNAAVLAEYFLQNGCSTKVVGVPKTIDGDLKSEDIEISFGFDSACKTYSEMIGNIARDAKSSKKYYHFIKLMGRSASHIVLECALATHPNLALISEEKKGLSEIIDQIATLIEKRSVRGQNYGVILIPEGLVESVPELAKWAEELDLEKDPHGNIELSKIQTEKLIIEQVQKELKKRGFKGSFNAQEHFLGYEGRCCMPTNFDANYCYSLGSLAFVAIREGLTGVTCAIQNLAKDPSQWTLKVIPIIQLMHMEVRKGMQKPVIKKVLVDILSEPFVSFARKRANWELNDQYRYPGPIQFFGPHDLTDLAPLTLIGTYG